MHMPILIEQKKKGLQFLLYQQPGLTLGGRKDRIY